MKAHVGIAGNERADQLAKNCFDDDAPRIISPAPISYAEKHIKAAATLEWEAKWSSTENGKHTREIFPTIEDRMKVGQLNLTFVLTQFLSGHGKFNGYLYDKHCRDDPSCKCGEDYQDSKHMLFECPLTNDIRRDLEADCLTRGWTFSIGIIRSFLNDPVLSEYFSHALTRIHHRLVLWET